MNNSTGDATHRPNITIPTIESSVKPYLSVKFTIRQLRNEKVDDRRAMRQFVCHHGISEKTSLSLTLEVQTATVY